MFRTCLTEVISFSDVISLRGFAIGISFVENFSTRVRIRIRLLCQRIRLRRPAVQPCRPTHLGGHSIRLRIRSAFETISDQLHVNGARQSNDTHESKNTQTNRYRNTNVLSHGDQPSNDSRQQQLNADQSQAAARRCRPISTEQRACNPRLRMIVCWFASLQV